ncbi:nuclear transport factor 2 family protein [Streptomyces sp. NPDC087866]|uniref:nuclear transport factor 2 family protein n=1 Tax=unclassified Streptomyces TaxID=2593676 RepID=UPI00225371DB|nr:nuclear transport factor 2 family protein [Streptomyces sp. NBC_01789]MCX4450346.1 nuclear transport factor 2 family protein [Streptomyces sp. NBC_01789]
MSQLETAGARTPREALAAYHRAMLDKSADDLADLYAPDALHEFPFTAPGFPPRYEGREAVRAGYRAVWGASPVRIDEVRTVSSYETADPEVIVAEHVVVGTIPAGASFAVPGLLVLRVRHGLITHVRDYMDTAALAAARG